MDFLTLADSSYTTLPTNRIRPEGVTFGETELLLNLVKVFLW